MKSASTKDAQYRHGQWGPAYLLKGATSDIGVLLLRPNDAVENHYHERCDETFIVIEGTSTLWLDCAENTLLTVGDVIRCEPGEMHYLINDSDENFRCMFIKSLASDGDTVLAPWVPGKDPLHTN